MDGLTVGLVGLLALVLGSGLAAWYFLKTRVIDRKLAEAQQEVAAIREAARKDANN